MSLDVIDRHTLTIGVHIAEVYLSRGVSLFGGPAEHLCGPCIILGNPLPIVVHPAKVSQSVNIVMIGDLAKPVESLLVILGYSISQVVRDA